MRFRSRQNRDGRKGFTLLELGIIIAVAGILAAAIVPDYLEGMRTRMVERVAEDFATLHDAARWFGQDNFRWPGETAPNCTLNYDPDLAKTEMDAQGYYTNSGPAYTNPWGQLYEINVIRPGASQCFFRITTNIPTQYVGAFRALLPLAYCNDVTKCEAGAPPSGYQRCCSLMPRPSAGVSNCASCVQLENTCMSLTFPGKGGNDNIICDAWGK